jgi:hypothetical protein
MEFGEAALELDVLGSYLRIAAKVVTEDEVIPLLL